MRAFIQEIRQCKGTMQTMFSNFLAIFSITSGLIVLSARAPVAKASQNGRSFPQVAHIHSAELPFGGDNGAGRARSMASKFNTMNA